MKRKAVQNTKEIPLNQYRSTVSWRMFRVTEYDDSNRNSLVVLLIHH